MKKRTPDFENNLLKILRKEKPDRATIFELYLNQEVYDRLSDYAEASEYLHLCALAMANAGYDYVTAHASGFGFRPDKREKSSTLSLNGNGLITDWESFEKFEWPDMTKADYSALERAKGFLPEGMKIMCMGPDGVLENAINLVGYDNLCIMLFEEPELVSEIFKNIGTRLVQYYENCASAETVGFICSNDDWGFNTQTFLSPEDMRKYVFPWHKKIVEAAHKNNKPCMLHSCGYYNEIIDDTIYDLKFDGRHSYEDNITPVEEAYEELQGKIAVMGGMDINFLATRTPEEVYTRARKMLERSADRGGYVLGSGNSIPAYIPYENYIAMNRAALEFDN